MKLIFKPMKKSQFDQDMIKLLEIKKNKYKFDKNIKDIIELDSLNKLKLLGYLDDKSKKTITIEYFINFKKFSDILKFINNK